MDCRTVAVDCRTVAVDCRTVAVGWSTVAGQSVGMVLSILHFVPQCYECTNQFMEMER